MSIKHIIQKLEQLQASELVAKIKTVTRKKKKSVLSPKKKRRTRKKKIKQPKEMTPSGQQKATEARQLFQQYKEQGQQIPENLFGIPTQTGGSMNVAKQLEERGELDLAERVTAITTPDIREQLLRLQHGSETLYNIAKRKPLLELDKVALKEGLTKLAIELKKAFTALERM